MSRISSPLGVGGIIFIIIGTIMVIAGIISLLANRANPSVWYVWLLIIGGMIFGIAGGIMLAIALSRPSVTQNVVAPFEVMPQTFNGNTAPTAVNFNPNPSYVNYQTPTPVHFTQAATDGNSVVSTSIQTTSYNAPSGVNST